MRLPSLRLVLLCVLYFVQGLPFGFQATALPVYLREQGTSLAALGFIGVLALPWGLKATWAPLVDRYHSPRWGKRRSWILPMQAGLTATCAAAALFTSPDALPLLMGLVLVMNFFAATQDIAVDGYAVDTLRPNELGLGNAIQVVGYKLGMLTGGGLLVWASKYIGWPGLFLAMSALCLGAFLVTLVARTESAPPQPTAASPEAPASEPAVTWAVFKAHLWTVVRRPGTGWLLLFVGTYKFGETMADVLYKPFLLDSGIPSWQIGQWVGTWGNAASILGSVTGGVLATRMPVLGALALTASLRVFPLVGRWWLATHGVSDEGVISVTLCEEFVGGALTTVMFAFIMSRVDSTIGATHYTLLASIEVWGKAPAAPLAGWLADPKHGLGLGYAFVFLLGAALSVAFLALLVPIARQRQPAPPHLAPAS
ncbi:MFS transporter [Myxococcus sp. K15C18031901]|uniref:MFS transporter n=1 Tax=Myxococcus dinghuensis TaxID=2906761 RepID=UPI0020A82355|nr:MFS transporter [Myxococcus dinghuensis]MCP3098142.1 MFS transporter [Myxococcus dinghuensis]